MLTVRQTIRHGRLLAALVTSLALAACVPGRWERPPAPAGAMPPPVLQPAPQPSGPATAPAPRPGASTGNPPFYEVFGERYYVMPDSTGYRATGTASWYGRQFHGKRTSSGAVFDMNELTAAHKTLPLPSLVRVTNLGNGKSVVVTVNDRGPFVANRIIDLSYAAARQLDMIGPGTAPVAVEALRGNSGGGPVLVYAPGQGGTGQVATGSAGAPFAPTVLPARQLYMQVGAFSDRANAQRLQQRLESNGVTRVVIRYDSASDPALFRVRIGPIDGSAEYDALASRVLSLRIADPTLVTETPAIGDGAVLPGR